MKRHALALVCAAVGLSGAPFGTGGCATPEPRGAMKTSKPTSAAATRPIDCSEAGAPYLAELCAMGEPSLTVQGPETYRFLWMRHLRNPVAVRLSRAGADVAVVTIESDAHDPTTKRRHDFVVEGKAWTALRGHLDAADFWNLAGDPGEDERGLDGADWIVEGRRGGIYHSVIRWNPPPGPFRQVCEDFIRISGLSFPTEIPLMGALRAPVAVPVEIRSDGGRRVFRLAASVGEDGLRLERPAPFEIGRPVAVAFRLPRGEGETALRLTAEVLHADIDDETTNEGAGGRELTFIEPSADARLAIRDYVRERLSLPE